jgi:phosphatidylglycerophosphatase A
MLGTPWSAALIVALFGLGVAAASRTEQVARRKDPSIVVVDEVVGMLVALWALPFQAGEAVAAFLCFRLFDIAKPFPIRRLEAQPGGWGIMLDDVVAGLYANAVVRIGRWALGLS